MQRDKYIAATMAAIDDLPKPWRELVHEYGFQIVAAILEEDELNGREPNTRKARATLKQWRARRQAEWLATDFIKPKENHA